MTEAVRSDRMPGRPSWRRLIRGGHRMRLLYIGARAPLRVMVSHFVGVAVVVVGGWD